VCIGAVRGSKNIFMKSSTLIIILLLALSGAMYFLGRKNGVTEIKSTVINNQQLVTQIAELSSLEVSGNTSVKMSNAGDNSSWWEGFKNYLAENTLQVTVPYKAKFGVDMGKGKVDIKQTDTAVVLNFPAVKMLSFQLELDKLETMNQTGLFSRTTIGDMKRAEQQMYISAKQQLESNTSYLEKAKVHMAEIFTNYYKPLGYKVICTFNQP
jgi:hypothetical protein